MPTCLCLLYGFSLFIEIKPLESVSRNLRYQWWNRRYEELERDREWRKYNLIKHECGVLRQQLTEHNHFFFQVILQLQFKTLS